MPEYNEPIILNPPFSLFVAGFSLLVTGYWLLVAGCWLLVAGQQV
jgi:hypothetical protein